MDGVVSGRRSLLITHAEQLLHIVVSLRYKTLSRVVGLFLMRRRWRSMDGVNNIEGLRAMEAPGGSQLNRSHSLLLVPIPASSQMPLF